MNWLDRPQSLFFRGRKKQESTAHTVLKYLERTWSEEPSDLVFEKKSLNRDLKFNSLDLAELIFLVSRKYEIPRKRIVHFLHTGIAGGGDHKLANLVERIAILAEHYDESERSALLSSGLVGDIDEVAQILPDFDNVGFVVKYCTAIRSLKDLEDHDAIDIEYGEVEEDSGSKMKKIKLAKKTHPQYDESHTAMLIKRLERGTADWNRWRLANPSEYIDLRQVSLFGKKLSLDGINLSEANLSEANLAGVELRGADLSAAYAVEANFEGAHLEDANLRGAYLISCNFTSTYFTRADLRLADLSDGKLLLVDCNGANLRKATLASAHVYDGSFVKAILAQADLSDAILREADFSRANLNGANLNGASLVETNLRDASLNECRVFGTSVWKTDLQNTQQMNLIITPDNEPNLTVDNIKVAQFIYLILNNEEVRNVIETITSKTVLLLGRFTPERKQVLDKLRITLRKSGYVPILFDFEGPSALNLTETVSTLAHLARFVIADITDPKSIPQELQRIIPDCPSLPVQPIILASDCEWGMFESFKDYPWVLPPYRYDSPETLVASLQTKVIDPAEAKMKEIEERRRLAG